MITYRYMEKLARALEVCDYTEPVLPGSAGMVEHLAHEVAHALSLGIPIMPGMAGSVDSVLSHRENYGVDEEAMVLASEETTLRGLGINGYDRKAARAAAAMQRVPNQLFFRAWRTDQARQLGLKALRYIGRRCGCYRSDRRMASAPRSVVMDGGL